MTDTYWINQLAKAMLDNRVRVQPVLGGYQIRVLNEVTVRDPVVGRTVQPNHRDHHYTGRDIQDTQLPPAEATTEKIELPDTETMMWKESSLELAQQFVQQWAMFPRREGLLLQLGQALAETVVREHDAS